MPFGFRGRGRSSEINNNNVEQPMMGTPQGKAPFMQRAYPYSLRWVLFFCSCLGLIWALAMGVNNFRYTTFDNESTKQKLFDVIQGILYFVTAGIELWALLAACLHKNFIAKPLLILAPIGALVAIAIQIVAVIGHFTLKSDKINQCVLSYTGPGVVITGTNMAPTVTQATNWCSDGFERGTWTVFAWLIVVIITSLLFCSLSMQYARQVANPSLIRPRPNRNQHQNQAYQMQPQHQQFNNGYYPPPPPPGQGWQNQPQNQQQGWMVPPYPGPPANTNNGGETPQFEKGDYHPEAEWANAGTVNSTNTGYHLNDNNNNNYGGYAPPSGSSPRAAAAGTGGAGTNPFEPTRPARDVIPNAEDEAWERARTEGVTAHLTGQGTGPKRTGGGAGAGGMV